MKGISMLLLCIIMMNLAVAIPTLNLNDTTEYTQSFDFPIIDLEINVSLQNVNSSDFWDALDTPADIDLTDLGTTNHNDLSNLDYASAAHTGFCSLDTYQVITGEKNFTGEVIFRGTSSPTDFKILEVLSGKALFTAHTEMGFGVDKLTRITIAGTDANSKFQVLDSSGNSPLTVNTVNNNIFFELGSSAESRLSFRYNATYFSSTIYARDVDPTPYIFNVGNGVKGSSGLGYSDYAQSFWVEFSEFNGLSLFADPIADDYRMEFFDWGAGIPTRPLKICNAGRGLYIQNCTDEKDMITIYPDGSQHWYSSNHVSQADALFTLNGTYHNSTWASSGYGLLVDTDSSYSITSAYGCESGASITNCMDAGGFNIIDVGDLTMDGNLIADEGYFTFLNTTTINATTGNFAGEVDVVGNITGNQIYAEAYYHNHTATLLNFASDGIFYNLTFSDYKLNGFSNGTNKLICNVAGRYLVNYMVSGDGQNNHEYYTTVGINGVDQDNVESHKKMTAGGDIVTMTGSGFIDLNEGDVITLMTADIGSTGTGNYYSSNLNLVRIGT